MTYAVLDVESTIYQHGHPFSDRNKLCLIGIRHDGHNRLFDVEYSNSPYGAVLDEVRAVLSSVDCVVGFNLKFDLNWLARYGCYLPDHVRVFDCQLAEFILNHQQHPFPSLDDCLAKYGLGAKSSDVLSGYWSVGIDTPEIPLDTLSDYLSKDLELTDALYLQHLRLLEPLGTTNVPHLIRLHNQDLRVLQEMESNGIRIDWSSMEQAALSVQKELDDVNREILESVPAQARDLFNTGSNDHVSLLLYGGSLTTKQATPYTHVYQSGPRAGESVCRNKWAPIQVQFPRLVDPLDGTALAKDGYWSTGADTLKELSKPKDLIKLLLKQAELSKLLSTYYHGLRKKRDEMDWQDGCLHSNLNQCAAVTGRLSSSGPNQQNFPESMNEFITTRYS